MNTIDIEPFTVGDIDIIPIEVWHLKMPVLGFRFGDFTYITDANRIEPQEIEKIYGTKYLTLNTLRKEKHISHFNLDEGIEMAKRINAGHTYFTHLSHQMGLHDEIGEILPEKINLAYDGLVIST